MRALYDHFLHGSRRHFWSEVWVSFELSQLDSSAYHHSHLIIDLPRFGILRMSGSSSSLIATLVSHLVSLLSSTSLFHFLLSSSIVISLHERRVFWCTSLVAWHCSLMCWLSCFAHMILQNLALLTQGFGVIYWVFRPLFPIISFTFHPCPTLRSES